MKIRYLKPFTKDFKKLPEAKKKKVTKQIKFLSKDLYHPSLNTRKMKGHDDIWEVRVDYHYRMTFKIIGETLSLRRVGTHEIYHNP